MEKQCEHFEKCGNLAEYELALTENGRTIHICGKCDENYSTCNVCGNAGIYDAGYGDMTYWHSTDEWIRVTYDLQRRDIRKANKLFEQNGIEPKNIRWEAVNGH